MSAAPSLHAPLSENQACAVHGQRSDERATSERASRITTLEKRTGWGLGLGLGRLALAARLGAIGCQLSREHLHVAVLGDLRTGLVHDARLGLVRARCERHMHGAHSDSWSSDHSLG